jgi:hypothetical protein
VLLALGYSAQTWDVNALSRCNSTFCTISSKELPVGETEGLNTQGHSEQPQPPKRFSSIQMSSRLAATYRRKIKYRVRVFRSIIFFSLNMQHHSVHLSGPPHESAQLAVSIRPQSGSSTGRVQVPPCTFGGKHAQTADDQLSRQIPWAHKGWRKG